MARTVEKTKKAKSGPFVAKVPLITIRIRVSPDETAPVPEPQVLLTSRDVKVPAVPTHIIWRKMPSAKKFKMISLEDLNTPLVFENIEIHNRRIEADFVPSGAVSKAHEYRLTIRYDGVNYDTDLRGPPAGDKAVIRN